MSSSRANKFIAIGAVAASMLMYEILLTRVCALRFFFHFAFLVISNCLLGLAASGALITLFQESWKPRERQLLVLFASLYLASLVIVYWAILTYPLPLGLDLSSPADFFEFSLFNLIGTIPFFTGGLVIGTLLTFNSDRVSTLYGADLIGAAIGCISMPFLLASFGAGGVLVVAALLGLAGLVGTLLPAETRKLALPVGVVGLAIGVWQLPVLDAKFPVPMKQFIELARNVSPDTKTAPLHSAWSSNSRIDVLGGRRNKGRFIFARGHKTQGQPPIPEQRVIMQDGSAGTLIVNFSDNPAALEIIERSMYSMAVHLKREPRVFIIGAGGGNDLWAAQAAGASQIKAIELNQPILDVHHEVLPHYTRALLEDPRIEIVVGEGRSALMRDSELYDVVQMTGIDTWTALASGAYVLAENYLYTQEALIAMHEHLAEDGILQIIRFAADMEALRMVSNLQAAFEELGRSNLKSSVVAFETRDGLMAFLVKKSPFTPAELVKLRRFSDRNGIDRVYMPGQKVGSMVEQFLLEEDKASFIADFPRNITPTTDDRPYFFNFTKWGGNSARFSHEPTMVSQGNPAFIVSQLLLSIVLSATLILLPAYRLRGLPHRGASRFLVYFASLGLGFILIEISILQKLVLFLGHPVYSLTVTLFSLLFFTGMGSLLFSGRFAIDDKRVWIVPGTLAVLMLLVIGLSPWLVANFIGLPLAARVAIAVLILAPISLLLGIPFAYGIRILDARGSALIPWAWAINGCFGVVGSILTVVISMTFGFNAVMLIATAIYAMGFWALRSEVTARS